MKSPAADLVGHDALIHGLSERLIQPLQKRRDALIVTAHECGEQSLVVYGDGGTFDRSHSSQHHVSAGTGEQRCDVRPAIIRVSRYEGLSPSGCSGGLTCRHRRCQYNIPRQEFVDTVDRMVCNAPENVAQITLWIDPVEFATSNEAVHRRRALSTNIRSHKQVKCLGDDPRKFDARGLRSFVMRRSQNRGHRLVKRCTTALRMFLRFLTTGGLCPVELEASIPVIAHWGLASLPRYLQPQDVERIIVACDPLTPTGKGIVRSCCSWRGWDFEQGTLLVFGLLTSTGRKPGSACLERVTARQSYP